MKLEEWFEKKGETIFSLAKKSGVSRQTIYDLLAGRTTPRVATAKKLSQGTRGAVSTKNILFRGSSE